MKNLIHVFIMGATILLSPFFPVQAGTTSPAGDAYWSSQPWYNGNVKVYLECLTDDLSGCNNSNQCTNGQPYEQVFTQNGETTLCRMDQAGNPESRTVWVNWIDKTKPEVVSDSLICNPNVWTNQNVTCSFRITDTLSFVNTLNISGFAYQDPQNKNNINQADSIQFFTFTEEGVDNFSNVTVVATDYANNSNTNQKPFSSSGQEIKIDKTSPTFSPVTCTSLTNNYTGAHDTNFLEGWTNQDVNCQYTLTDPNPSYNSGLKSWSSSVSPSTVDNWVENTNNQDLDSKTNTKVFSVEQKSSYTFSGEVRDNTDNTTSHTQEFPIKIDKTAPVLSAGSIRVKNADGGGFSSRLEANENFLININAIDPLPASGINIDKSYLTITGPVSLGQTALSDLSSQSGISFINTDPENIVSEVYIDNGSNLFTKVGDYTLTLELKDKATNQATPVITIIEIVATEVDQGKSSVSTASDCGAAANLEDTADLLANNDDTCLITATLKDRFENPITEDRDFYALFGKIESGSEVLQDINQNIYNIITHPEASFLNGLRFANGDTQDLNDNTGIYTFDIKALVPTVDIITSNMKPSVPGEPAENVLEQPSSLLKRIKRAAELLLKVQDVNYDGTNASTNTTINYAPEVIFDPWVKLYLSNKTGLPGTFPDDSIQYSIGAEQSLFEYLTTDTGKILPSDPQNFITTVIGHIPNGAILNNATVGNYGFFKVFNGVTTSDLEEEIKTSLRVLGGGLVNDISVVFTSEIKIRIQEDLSDVTSRKTIIYPGGNLGNRMGENCVFGSKVGTACDMGAGVIAENDAQVDGIMIGADIEGQIVNRDDTSFLSQETGGVDESRIVRMGNVSVLDVREDITRSAYALVRGRAATNGDTSLDLSSLEDGGVSYFRGGMVEIGQIGDPTKTVSGKHTLVIEDGNLWIKSDIKYNSPEASLGVILINSSVTPNIIPAGQPLAGITTGPDTGNIFVNNQVQHMVGTYFAADGAFLSSVLFTKPSSDDILDFDSEEAEEPSNLGKQLVLEGTLLTRNTLGGSMIEPLVTPWGKIETLVDAVNAVNLDRATELAQKYDLHFVRRHNASRPDAADQTSSDPTAPPVATLGSCTRINDACDSNKHSFVIRPDGRIQNNPPPGFETN